MKKLFTIVAVAATLALSACTTVTPGYGMLGGDAVVPGVSMNKTGEASGKFLFGVFPLTSADVSVSTAAKNGGIKKIATVDSKKYSLLGILVTKTTIVTGE